MTDRKAEKFKTSGVPILANSGPSMEKVYQNFIYLSLKSQDTQKTYYFATTNFLNFCFSNDVISRYLSLFLVLPNKMPTKLGTHDIEIINTDTALSE